MEQKTWKFLTPGNETHEWKERSWYIFYIKRVRIASESNKEEEFTNENIYCERYHFHVHEKRQRKTEFAVLDFDINDAHWQGLNWERRQRRSERGTRPTNKITVRTMRLWPRTNVKIWAENETMVNRTLDVGRWTWLKGSWCFEEGLDEVQLKGSDWQIK